MNFYIIMSYVLNNLFFFKYNCKRGMNRIDCRWRTLQTVISFANCSPLWIVGFFECTTPRICEQSWVLRPTLLRFVYYSFIDLSLAIGNKILKLNWIQSFLFEASVDKRNGIDGFRLVFSRFPKFYNGIEEGFWGLIGLIHLNVS